MGSGKTMIVEEFLPELCGVSLPHHILDKERLYKSFSAPE
jgi:hypothetical protein